MSYRVLPSKGDKLAESFEKITFYFFLFCGGDGR